MVSEIFEIGYI